MSHAAPLSIALIFGCARSGTSILGELIAAHPATHYIYEAHEVWEMAGLGPNGSHRLTEADATPEVTAAIRSWFESQAHASAPSTQSIASTSSTAAPPMIVEKCPRNSLRIPFLRLVLPEAKLIHIVRDGRDVTCSLRPGVGGDTWNHLKPPDWTELFKLPWAERCARLWLEVVETAERDLAVAPPAAHTLVRYEDLVRDPRATARKIFAFLDLDWAPEIDAFLENISDEAHAGYHAQGATRRWNTADHARRIGRWRENLSQEERARVTEILSDALTRFGYAI